MKCCLCAYIKTGEATDAYTVIGGYAVCYDHMGYVAQGMEWHNIFSHAKNDAER